MQVWTPSASPKDEGEFKVHLNPGKGEPFAVIYLTEYGDTSLAMQSVSDCDRLIKAAALARSMLLGETSEPVPQPVAECEEPHPGGRSVCTRKPGHAGGHVDGHGMYWPRGDGGSEDLDAALTPPGYSLPAGELAAEDGAR